MPTNNRTRRETCILGKSEKDYCEGICATCGWDRDVAAYRAKIMRARGLTRCSDGLYRFILPGEKMP